LNEKCRSVLFRRNEIKQGLLSFNLESEDIHMFLEQVLIGTIDEVGKKLHTGRNRNDQTARD
jgi:argininosuccinate lyase